MRTAARRSIAFAPAVVAAIVAILSGLPRIAVAAGTLPPPARPFVWSDLLISYQQLLIGGKIPYWQTVFYYPPIVGYLAGAFAVTTHDAVGYLVAWTALTAAVAAGVAALLTRTVGVKRTLLYWSGAPQLLLYSGMNFDVLPTAAFVVSIVLLRSRRAIGAFAALAVGTLMKAFPAAAVPVFLDRSRHEPRRAIGGAVVFVAVGVLIALPSELAPWPSTRFAGDYARLTNFDSFWGIFRAAWSADADLVINVVTTAGLLLTYLLLVIPALRRGRADPAVAGGLAVLTLMFWSRLYSPQYSIWALPIFALVAVPRRWFALLVLADLLVFVTVYPLSLVVWRGETTLHAIAVFVLAAGIVLRQVALLGTWLAVRRRAIELPAPES